MSPATHGLYLAVAGLLLFLAGMVTAAGLLARYVVREDAREQRADDIRESLYAADWRPATNDISLWDTQRLALVPVQRVPEGAAA